ncbi:uncharacterized protein [Musca autumnalis]|uniref:uncharacterized protein n=1 Tax=Musca autumnalis TaxID=221902 RepID=UPI003CEA2BD6
MTEHKPHLNVDNDDEFVNFIRKKIQHMEIQTSSSPTDTLTIVIDADDEVVTVSPKIETIDCDSPSTPMQLHQQQMRSSTVLQRNYNLINEIRKSSPFVDKGKLHPLSTTEDDCNLIVPSPRTPTTLPCIWQPLPSYRLGRLRRHFDAHRRP